MSDEMFAPDRDPSDPTPKQIEERSKQIRKRWSHRVLQRRRVNPLHNWLPPLIMTVELVREMNAREAESA